MKIPSLKAAWKKIFPSTGNVRGYRDLVKMGGQNSDWQMQSISDDADLWQNAYALTSRVRDLFKANPLYIKYRELLWANIYGSDGIMLRMKCQETENRVVYAPDEKKALFAHEKRINRLREWAAKREGNTPESYRAFKIADTLDRKDFDCILRGQAMVEIGAPDVYANQLIERKRIEWQRKEFSDLRGTRNYFQQCLLRLIGAVRDGDFFIRMIRNPEVNKFGFSLQMINGEWCDRFLNCTLDNGNVIIMGIEYEMTPWGLGQVVAFYFITRAPSDWQYSLGGMFGMSGPARFHQRIEASDIIHYARPVDADATRPAPWVASTIPKGRQLDQFELAEVVAAREAACKVGYLYSDVNPEGGMSGIAIDPTTGVAAAQGAGPGDTVGLPWGVKFQERDSNHPTQNFESFRKGMVRSITAGMPAADYNTLANDLENINFSAGRLGRLDTNEMSKMLQRWDIDTAERPIFEGWLEMSLITGAIPLPVTKMAKFNRPVFQGRRWAQVDEVKAVNAAALRVANLFSSDQRECAEEGVDLEEILFEQAESNMMKEMLGLSTVKTVEHEPAATDENGSEEDAATSASTGDTTKPSPTKKPAKEIPVNGNGSNGHRELIQMPITLGKGNRSISILRDSNNRIIGATTEE